MRKPDTHFWARFTQDEQGASAIEAAICFPIIIMMAFGIFQYGIFYNNSTDLNHKFRDASRQVKFMNNPGGDILKSHYQQILGEYSEDVTLSVQKTDRYGESFAEVQMTYSYTIDIPLLDKYPLTTQYKNLIMLSSDLPG